MTLSDQERDIIDQEWIVYKNKALVVPVESWGEIKKYMLEACKQFNNCEQTKKKIEQLENI